MKSKSHPEVVAGVPARFTIELTWGLRLTLTLYPFGADATSLATMTPAGFHGVTPIFSFFASSECRLIPPAVESRHVPWSLWLGSVCLDVNEAEATALQEFITAARAGQEAGA